MVKTSQLVFLDTRHSETPLIPHDTRWGLFFPIAEDISGYSIAFQNVEFPNLRYPVHTLNNQVFFAENGGGLLTATIPPNNYTGTQFAAELQTQLIAVGALDYTVTFDSQSKLLTIVADILPNTVQFFTGQRTAMDEIAGFLLNTADLNVLLADFPIRLDGTRFVDISTDISNMNWSSSGGSIMARIPLSVPFGNIVFYEPVTDDFIQLTERDISNVSIRLLDDRQRPFVLPQNADVSYVLKISIIG